MATASLAWAALGCASRVPAVRSVVGGWDCRVGCTKDKEKEAKGDKKGKTSDKQFTSKQTQTHCAKF